MPAKYLSRTEVAEMLGLTPGTIDTYKMPEPDAIIGATTNRPTRGWLPETIHTWNENRPGRGRWRKEPK